MKCRHCGFEVTLPFIDLGTAPPSNAYLKVEALEAPEVWLPLRVGVCQNCRLVQTYDFASAESLFTEEYAYFSSVSTSWVEHARRYVEAMRQRFNLSLDSMVCEVAANDGYLLSHVKAAGIPCYGVEPTRDTAEAARKKGIDIVESFFGYEVALKLIAEGRGADLTAANNVLAHVPDINDFVKGFAILLKEQGVATFEFPHLINLVRELQFDTIYHEHFSYLSLTAVKTILSANGLLLFDVEKLDTHGGSLRVYAQRSDSGRHQISSRVNAVLAEEDNAGINTDAYYNAFQAKAEKVKDDFVSFLLDARVRGLKVAAYGAAAKGNTLINFAGIRRDLISFVVDRNPQKAGKFMPGSRIPIVDENILKAGRPDVIVILPWNLKNEIGTQLAYVKEWGGKLVTVVPTISTLA